MLVGGGGETLRQSETVTVCQSNNYVCVPLPPFPFFLSFFFLFFFFFFLKHPVIPARLGISRIDRLAVLVETSMSVNRDQQRFIRPSLLPVADA